VIRPARPDDVDTILDLVKELAAYERAPDSVKSSESDFHEALFGTDAVASALIAEHEGADGRREVAGFALWFRNFSTWVGKPGMYLEDLYVRPAFRGHGYGRALLGELARIANDRGYGRLEWAVLDWNTPAHGFYRALGAAPTTGWTVWRLAGADLERFADRV